MEAAAEAQQRASRRKLMNKSLFSLEKIEGPRRWNPEDKDDKIEISQDGLQITYVGQGGQEEKHAASVRSDVAVPLIGVALFYYEVKIIEKGETNYIAFGLCQKSVPNDRLPGWDENSLGYHSDDGMRFEGKAKGEQYGPKCFTGDVVGVCWNLIDSSVFFTKNGEAIGIAFRDVAGRYYPSVGLQSRGGIVLTNFGDSPFEFDIERYAFEQKEKLLAQAMKMQIHGNYETFSEIILNYLLHNGFIETAKAYATDIGKLDQLGSDIDFASRRKEICDLVREGKIGEAIDALRNHFPGILEDAKSKIVFRLKCQQLVEMSRAQPLEERLAFAQEKLYDYQDMGDEFVDDLKDIVVLLAYPNPSQSPYTHLLETKRREEVAIELNRAIKESRGKPGSSTLEQLVANCNSWLKELQHAGNGAILSMEDVLED